MLIGQLTDISYFIYGQVKQPLEEDDEHLSDGAEWLD